MKEKSNVEPLTSKEGYCVKRVDEIHCEHWWDGEGCCACGAPPMTKEEKRANGMIE